MPKRNRQEFYPTKQVKDLLQQTKTLQGFWGGTNGNASTSEVINYIICDYLLDSSNIQSCEKCSAWLKFKSQMIASSTSTGVIECPLCKHENVTEL